MKWDKCRAWLFTNHCPSDIVSGFSGIESTDLLIAVDAGLAVMQHLGLTPQVIVGDMDSVGDKLLTGICPDTQIMHYASAKNETDTELAVLWCIEQGIREIVICNDMQGRFDHAMALVQNLLLARWMEVKCRIESSDQIVRLLEKETVLSYPPGTLLSLIALSDKAVFESSEGLDYALHGITLYQHLSRGISNRISKLPAMIGLREGTVLAILTIL